MLDQELKLDPPLTGTEIRLDVTEFPEPERRTETGLITGSMPDRDLKRDRWEPTIQCLTENLKMAKKEKGRSATQL